MADLIKNIIYPFYLKGDDFKELSLKALPIKEWFDNHGQELAEFIYRHLNHYALNGYKDVNLKDVKNSISKVDFMFKDPLLLIEYFTSFKLTSL